MPPSRHVVTTRAVVKQAETDVIVSHASAIPWWAGPYVGTSTSPHVHTTRKDGEDRPQGGRVSTSIAASSWMPTSKPCNGVERDGTDTRVAIEVEHHRRPCRGIRRSVAQRLPASRSDHGARAVRRRYDATMDHWPASRATEVVIRLGDPRIASISRDPGSCASASVPACRHRSLQYPVLTPDTPPRRLSSTSRWPDLGAVRRDQRQVQVPRAPGARPEAGRRDRARTPTWRARRPDHRVRADLAPRLERPRQPPAALSSGSRPPLAAPRGRPSPGILGQRPGFWALQRPRSHGRSPGSTSDHPPNSGLTPPSGRRDERAQARRAVGYSPVTTKTTRLATETAWSAIRS